MPDFGFDLFGITDITPSTVAVGGRLALVQGLCRRLMTPRGTLFYDRDYGFDLRRLMNAAIVNTREVSFQIEQEMLKDDRVRDAQAAITRRGPNALRVAITLRDQGGPFDFVLGVTDLTVELLRR